MSRPLSGSLRNAPASLAVALAALAALGCEGSSPLGLSPGPVVRQTRLAAPGPFLGKVAVMPFYPEGLPAARVPEGVNEEARAVGWQAADLIADTFSQQLASRGVVVLAPAELQDAFDAQGTPMPRLDARAVAELASRDLGATSVVIGRVTRYRDREGSAGGASRPASVAFEASLHEAPGGRRIWIGRFDETQVPLSSGLFRARSYPGGGTRWLSAEEMARWGADEAARALLEGP